jgi:hypothetical protein
VGEAFDAYYAALKQPPKTREEIVEQTKAQIAELDAQLARDKK